MRLLISAASALALAILLLAACGPRDTSAPSSNSSAARTNAAKAAANAPGGADSNSSGRQSSPVGAQVAPAPQAGEDVARITQDELNAGLKNGSVVLFDVRDKLSYEAGHIKGAKNVPWDEVEDRLAEFPKDKQIVTYCA